MCDELGVADWSNFSRIHLGVSPFNFFIIRSERPVGESVQQERHQSLPIFFRKLFRLFFNV